MKINRNKQTVNCQTPDTSLEKKQTNKKKKQTNKQKRLLGFST